MSDNFMKIFLQTLNERFPTIEVNIFCNEERLIIEIDKYEIFYYSNATKEFKYNHIPEHKAKEIKSLYVFSSNVGDING